MRSRASSGGSSEKSEDFDAADVIEVAFFI
jgi:hypothetical protein